MWRSPFGPYKHGRGTWREGYIGKLKRFEDTEGILVDIEEGQTNMNIEMRDNMGFAKRSYEKDGMVLSGMAGALIVDVDGVLARVAPGALKHDERKHMLENPKEYIGRPLTFRHFPHGAKDTFRQAKFAAWRSRIDL
jgi:DNA ligase-1